MYSKCALIKGVCHVNSSLNNRMYQISRLELIDNFYGKIRFGLDFQKQYTAVTFVHGGTEPELKVYGQKTEICSLAASNLLIRRLFVSLKPHVQPTITKSRTYNLANQQCPAQEIKHLLAGVIEPSSYFWKAEVVIVKDEFDSHKKCMHVDYSNSVNVNTELDVYLLPKI